MSAENSFAAWPVLTLWKIPALIVMLFAEPALANGTILLFDHPQTAGISGFRAHWDVPIPVAEDGVTRVVDTVVKDRSPTAVWSPAGRRGSPGATAFDALNRSLLVRFPGATATILDWLQRGYVIRQMQLMLPYRDTELWPPGDTDFAPADGYLYRTNWGVDQLYRSLAPQWHAVAWALRRPWQSDERIGPTFNANVNGTSFWTKYGAADEQQDRFPMRFGPAEVSERVPEGQLDITQILNDPIFGDTVSARLRYLECCGFVVNKLETYDVRYLMRSYEWGTATGGRAILIKTPRLIVHLSEPNDPNMRPESISPIATAPSIAESPPARTGGSPTAVMPSTESLDQLTKRFLAKPSWMPAWQWDRVNELKRLGGSHTDRAFFYDLIPSFAIDRLAKARSPQDPPRDIDVFGAWVDSIMGHQPRDWNGFDAAPQMTQWFVYGDALPAVARDAFRRYWTGWLMPNRKAARQQQQLDLNLLDGSLIHPQADQLSGTWNDSGGVVNTYYAKTGDWQGNQSFYRSGYTFNLSTQNFNHTAAVGALLGGAVIGSENAIADGRHGWESFPLRHWTWSRGFSQESIDHYYFAITLSDQKTVADFAPTLFDRLMSESMLAKSLDELIAAYHPGLRRFVAASTRTSLEYLLAKQDGLQYLLNTLSRAGTLHDIGNPKVKTLLPGLASVIGEEMPPLRAAIQATSAPWAPEWAANLVDDKPIPYRAVAKGDGIATSYLGQNYGIATGGPNRRIPLMAHWRRTAKPVETMSELVTVVARYGVNETRFANDSWGFIAPAGSEAFLQHDNKVLMLASPRPNFLRQKVEKEGLRSLQTSIAFFNYQQPAPNWEIYVDGNQVTHLPYSARAGARIAIRDGTSFFSVITLPGTDLGGGNVVELREGTAQDWNGVTFKPALVIDAYNLRSAVPIVDPDWNGIEQAVGGFALEAADSSDYPSFAAFQQHLATVEIQARFAEPSARSASYKSGADLLETGVAINGDALTLIEPKVNGRTALLPAGILRDTTASIQGNAATIEKSGATLRGEQGRMKFIQVEARSGTFVAWNPLPDLTKFSFEIPGGSRIQSDGRIGLARVLVNTQENRVAVTHAWGEEQAQNPDAATALVLLGFENPPKVDFNGEAITTLASHMLNGRPAYLLPLRDAKRSVTEMEKALRD
jgi:hypothetical protein